MMRGDDGQPIDPLDVKPVTLQEALAYLDLKDQVLDGLIDGAAWRAVDVADRPDNLEALRREMRSAIREQAVVRFIQQQLTRKPTLGEVMARATKSLNGLAETWRKSSRGYRR